MFKFVDFAKRKSLNEVAFSPPVYSSPGGYKICLEVFANGKGKRIGSHVSVLARLMRGENDDNLTWPFTGKVVIDLINQLDDKNHWSKTVRFKEDKDGSQRVVEIDNDRENSCFGRPEYVPHSSLGYNPANNCQYLKDDCLYFRMKIKSESAAPKSWLASANVF